MMAHRSANSEELESPFRYAKKINEEISSRLAKELEGISLPSG